MKKILFVLMAAVAVACSGTADNSYTVSGKFNVFDSDSVWLLTENMDYIASVPSTDGSFEFTGNVENPEIAIVAVDRMAESVGCVLILEPGNITMTSVLDSFYVAGGTKANDKFSEFMKMNYQISVKIKETGGRATDELMSLIDGVEKKVKDDLMDNLDNYYGLFCVERLASRDDPESTRIFLDKFPESVKGSDWWNRLSKEVDGLMSFGLGKPYADFTQNDPDGKPVTASKVIKDPKNRYVLIDFWASWCGPCMRELPDMKEAYAKYASKGFEILAVSLDQDRDSWINAIKENEMNWIHVSDLKYWENEVARQYGINSIPSNFLIDCKTGLIVSKGLRGRMLENTLSDLLE